MSTNYRTNHEIDFHIYGEEMKCVEIELDHQETAIAESGRLYNYFVVFAPIFSPSFSNSRSFGSHNSILFPSISRI